MEAIMELLNVCLRTPYFQAEDKFFQQKEGMAMGSSPSLMTNNIYMEHFEKMAIDSAQLKPSFWVRYVDDTFVVWPHGPERLQQFFEHLNSLRPSIQFTMEMESDSSISFLDVLVIKKEKKNIGHQSLQKIRTHTGRYLNPIQSSTACKKKFNSKSSHKGLHNMPRTE
jgi:hypothetical protein